MHSYQQQFVDFLVSSQVLTFGDFVTKSGRHTPYFINAGNFNDGRKICELGRFYAAHISNHGLLEVSSVFGPAYKGIPLCVATAQAIYQEHKKEIGFTFDRKEEKTHGDGGTMVGYRLQDGDKIVIVEDVITAGTTLRSILPQIQQIAQIEVLGVVIAVDRCEKGVGEASAVVEAETSLGISILPIVTIHQIVEYLSSENSSGLRLESKILERINAYLEEYGA